MFCFLFILKNDPISLIYIFFNIMDKKSLDQIVIFYQNFQKVFAAVKSGMRGDAHIY
jgi:hypothetical protein